MTEPELKHPEHTLYSQNADDYHIVFEQVGFSYNKKQPTVQDISFRVRHGQTMGIIGPTGSGKSTVLKLLMRLYDTDSGEILIDGTNIKMLSQDDLYKKLGVVFQNDFLMANTLRDNISFGRDVSDEDLKKAVTCAQASFIKEQQNGLEFELQVKGHNLSGGQQQRVLIARSLAAGPGLLLLDDCSSALDYRTDRALRHALREEYSDVTTIIVAQRVSAVMAADLILVMNEGRIIGAGDHQTLLKNCGMYAELCKLQLGGEDA